MADTQAIDVTFDFKGTRVHCFVSGSTDYQIKRASAEPVLLQMRHVDDVKILNRDFQTQISYHQEVLQFADPDAPLTKFDKILLGAMLTFLYSAFAVAVALTIHYNG